MYLLKTLGELSLGYDDGASRAVLAHSRALLIPALLATSPQQSGRRDHLAELLWPGLEPARSRRSLRQAVHLVSKSASGILIKDGDELILNQDALRIDLWEFEKAMRRGDYSTAVGLYTGPFLSGYARKVGPEVEQWIEAQNSRLEGQLEIAYSALIADAIEGADGKEAIRYARGFAQACPLHESAQASLIRALRANGDEIGALGAYHEYRALMAAAFGDEPDAILEASMQHVREELMRAPAAVSDGSRRFAGLIRRGPDRRSSTHKRRIAWSLSAAILVAVGATLTAAATRDGPSGPLSQISARLLVLTEQGADTTLSMLTVAGKRAVMEPIDSMGGSDLPSPDGSMIAFAEAASDGWNLAIRSIGDPDGESLTTTPQDEFPIAWSPDGRYLLYTRRIIPNAGRRYLYEVQVFDLAARQSRRLTTLRSTRRPTAAWSPDGTRIMFTVDARGRTDIFRIDFDGQNLRNVTSRDGTDADPAWRPDAERVAYVSERDAVVDVMTMRPDGSDPQPLTRSNAVEREPHWVSQGLLVFIAESERGSDVWALDAFSGESRQLSSDGNVVAIRRVFRTEERPRWIEKIVISPPTDIASPGQHIALQVHAITVNGDTVSTEGLPIRWSISDGHVIRLNGPGLIQVDSVGRGVVSATVAGWRTNRLAVLSVPLVELPISPAISEDWTGMLDETKWLPFGDPVPLTRNRGGPGGAGVFVNNGDAFFESGAILRTPLKINNGLTVETAGKLQFTGQLHQSFGIGLRTTLPEDSIELGATGSLIDFRIQGPSADEPLRAWIATPEERYNIPFPWVNGEWHAFALQILPDGTIELVVDGKMYWRSPRRLGDALLQTAETFVTLGYRSSRTEVQHGPVSVYLVPKYRLPDSPAGAGTPAQPGRPN